MQLKTGHSYNMNALEDVEGLSECIGRAIQEHLAKSDINIAWPQIERLNHPILRFEAFLEDAGPSSTIVPLPEKVASVSLLLFGHEYACNRAATRFMLHRGPADDSIVDFHDNVPVHKLTWADAAACDNVSRSTTG